MLRCRGEVAGSQLFHHAQHLQYANAFGQAGFVRVRCPHRPGRFEHIKVGKARSQEAARSG